MKPEHAISCSIRCGRRCHVDSCPRRDCIRCHRQRSAASSALSGRRVRAEPRRRRRRTGSPDGPYDDQPGVPGGLQALRRRRLRAPIVGGRVRSRLVVPGQLRQREDHGDHRGSGVLLGRDMADQEHRLEECLSRRRVSQPCCHPEVLGPPLTAEQATQNGGLTSL